MTIRPLDMQVMIPKLQEVAKIRQTENQRAGINQSNLSDTTQKETSHTGHSVGSSHKDQETDHNADAKEESKNKYGYKPSNKKKKEDNNPPADGSYHKIDVKI